MIFLKIYIVALTLLMIVHTAFTYAVARAFRVRVLEIGFCLGPTLVKRKVGTITFRINSIPLGSYLKLLENAESLKLDSDSDGGCDSDTEVEFELGNDRFYDDLNPLVRGAISAAGTLGLRLPPFCYVVFRTLGIPALQPTIKYGIYSMIREARERSILNA